MTKAELRKVLISDNTLMVITRFINKLLSSLVAYAEPFQTSEMGRFPKLVNGLTFFAKRSSSMFDRVLNAPL